MKTMFEPHELGLCECKQKKIMIYHTQFKTLVTSWLCYLTISCLVES